MNAINSQHQTLISTIRYALVILIVCYLPHFILAPWWLFILLLSTVAYRLTADYYGFPLLHKGIRVAFVIGLLFLLKMQYGSILSNGFFVGFLLTFISLKIIEIHTMRDLKVIVFCNFYLIFSALIMIQELWIVIYLMITIIANFSLMLRLSAPQASLKEIGSKSVKHLLIAIPLSILLFYLFPRIDPLWQVPSQKNSRMGFSEEMNPGSIEELFHNDAIAMQITFTNKPLIYNYWRGLTLSIYNGMSWNRAWQNQGNFPPLPLLNSDTSADYEVMLEPHQKKWLFYSGTPVSGNPDLLFSSSYGLVSQDHQLITQRFSYALKVQSAPTYNPLNENELIQNTQLPKYLNSKLIAWAKKQYSDLNQNPSTFINFLKNYLKQQPFWYTLTPPPLTETNDQMDYFWFETQKGFCEHYASAITVILRAVGIPARIVVGYQGGEWNPLSQYLTIHQNDAHAWLEYWQDGIGWQEFDPTAFIAQERIDQTIKEHQSSEINDINQLTSLGISWYQRAKLLFSSAQFFADRWLLFYNQNAQHELLKKLGLGEWSITQLIQAAVGCFILFLIILSVFYQWRQKRACDPLLKEYHLLQTEFRRFNVLTQRSATLKQQCDSLTNKEPQLSSILSAFLSNYEQLRLKPNHLPKDNKRKTIQLFRKLRVMLRQKKPSKVQ